MNNAQEFVASLTGQTITFKPIEKGKDRPVQTIHFKDIVDMPISTGGTVPAFNVVLIFAGKRGIIQTNRQISVARALEYVGQAASATEQYDEIVYVAPEPVVKAEKAPKAEKEVKPKKVSVKEQKRLDAEAAAQVAADAGEAIGEAGDDENFGDPFADEDGEAF